MFFLEVGVAMATKCQEFRFKRADPAGRGGIRDTLFAASLDGSGFFPVKTLKSIGAG